MIKSIFPGLNEMLRLAKKRQFRLIQGVLWQFVGKPDGKLVLIDSLCKFARRLKIVAGNTTGNIKAGTIFRSVPA